MEVQWKPGWSSMAFSLFAQINQSACNTLDWVLNSQSEFEWWLYKYHWEIPTHEQIIPMLTRPIVLLCWKYIGSRLNISFSYIHFIYSPWPFVFVVYTFTLLNLKNTAYLIVRKWEQSKHIGLCNLENPGQVLQNVIWRSCFHVNINTIILLSIFPVETVATR